MADDNTTPKAPPSVDERIANLERVIATRETPPAQSQPAAPAAATPVDYAAIGAAVAAAIKATTPAPAAEPAAPATTASPTTRTPPPAAAPAAPTSHSLPTSMGVVDLFSLQPHELNALGPRGVRENLEKLWAIGAQSSGAPARPKPPGQK